MISLLLAGGIYVAAAPQAVQWPVIDNHTLRGKTIPSDQVVCRNMWGTPMLPDGKGGYSLIAPINPAWIEQSLFIPPNATRGMVAFRPLPPASATVIPPAPVAPTQQAPAPAPAPAAAAPAEAAPPAPAPASGAAPAAAPGDPFAPAAPAPAAN